MNETEIKLKHCITILNTFPRGNKSLTIHVEDYFINVNLCESDRLFVVDIFAETIRYHKVLKVIVDQYYGNGGESVLEIDRNMYMVITFLLIFRLDSLGINGLRLFIGRDRRVVKFLSFVTEDERLWTTTARAHWERMYDYEFVCNELLDGLTRWMPRLCSLSKELTIAIGVVRKLKKSALVTKPEPFKLTRPKAKRVPLPDLIPEMERPREIPQSTYTPPDELKKPQKKDATILLEEAEKLKPSCADRGMSTKTMEKLKQIVVDREKEFKFDGVKARPNPKSNNDNTTTKLNTATILREWKLYESRQRKKIDELKKLEEGSFNSLQFEEWQQSVRAADLAERISQIERRRLEGKISYEEAILNRENIIQENKAMVELLKRETGKRMEKFMREKAAMEERAKEQVEKVMASEEGAKDAKIAVQKRNKSIAREIAAESKRLQEEVLIEAEAEMRRKMDIIAEIRALEGSQSSGQKTLDPTEVAGYGLLCEMSLAELRERLTLCKKNTEEQLNLKKDNIQDSKQQKERQLADTVELIEVCRQRAKESNGDEMSERSVEILTSDQLKELDLLKSNLEMKRFQRQRQQDRDKLRVPGRRDMVDQKQSLDKELTFDKISAHTLSQTAEKLSRVLSV